MNEKYTDQPSIKVPASSKLRRYGSPPYTTALVHGGPGGAGSMAPVARKLSREFGVVEPLITTKSLQGQINELANLLAAEATKPVTLVGHSYGSWLSVMVAANSPELVKKLVLISSGAFTTQGVADIESERRSRLSKEERLESERLGLAFESASPEERENIWLRYGQLCLKSDGYSPIDAPNEVLPGGAAVFQAVWPEAAALRDSGRLLQIAERISCPIALIHGDHDPQPVAGVAQPLEKLVTDIQCIVLANCGHTPWIERDAHQQFYSVLAQEIRTR